jgi:hypothetical protein
MDSNVQAEETMSDRDEKTKEVMTHGSFKAGSKKGSEETEEQEEVTP